MRIIAGKYKRRLIGTVDSLEVRPTTDRVRETVFNLLTHRFEFDGAVVLDLFAGSGSLGFEALSRGAKRVTFVEQQAAVAAMLQVSIEKLGVQSETLLVRQDAVRFIQAATQPFDLIFIDPPYKSGVHLGVVNALFERRLLSERGYLVLEHHESETYDAHPHFSFSKNFGLTTMSFFGQLREDNSLR